MSLIQEFNWDDLPKIIEDAGLSDGFVTGLFSDHLYTGPWKVVKDSLMKENARFQLECIRVFDRDHEIKIYKKAQTFYYRDSADYRIVKDPDELSKTESKGEKVSADHIIVKQILDIDEKRSEDIRHVQATGGGAYSLEGSGITKEGLDGAKIILEEYIQYYVSGQAYICDWRILGFENGGSNGD